MTRTYQYQNKKTKQIATGAELTMILQLKKEANSKCDDADKNLKEYLASRNAIGPLGLVKDEIKSEEDYKKLKEQFNIAFKQLQKVNTYIKNQYKTIASYTEIA